MVHYETPEGSIRANRFLTYEEREEIKAEWRRQFDISQERTLVMGSEYSFGLGDAQDGAEVGCE